MVNLVNCWKWLKNPFLFSHLPDESGNADDEMIPPKIAGSFVCSTPMRQSQSLCMELKEMVGINCFNVKSTWIFSEIFIVFRIDQM